MDKGGVCGNKKYQNKKMGYLLIHYIIKIFIDQKNILIVFHGDLLINNEKNPSGGQQNASTGNSNNGVEEKANEVQQQQQSTTITTTTSQLTELCWEVFDLQNKKSLTGVQSIKQEEISLSTIQNYILDIQKDLSAQISFLVSDKRIYNTIKSIDQFKWSYKYEFYDILHQAFIIFSENKTTIKELLDYFSFQKEQSTIQKSETFLTAQLISKIVLIMLRTTIPFKDALNELLLKSSGNDSVQELLNAQQSPLSISQQNNQVKDSILQVNQLLNNSGQNQQKLDKEEVWGDQSETKDTKLNEQIEGSSNASNQEVNSGFSNGLGSLISSGKNHLDSVDKDSKKKGIQKDRQESKSRSRSRSSKDNSRSSGSSGSSSSYSYSNSRDNKRESRYSRSKRNDSYMYLRLRGLPFNSRENELQDFLQISLEQDQISFKHDNDGRFSGECVIRTRDQAQYDKVKDMHMRNMGKRYIEIFVAERSDFVRAQESQSIDDQKGMASQSNSSFDTESLQGVSIVKIRGLPYNASDQDIQQFFKDSQIMQNGIQKVYDGRRPSGEAFILFATKQDAQRAIEKDKQRMGSRYIEIFLSHLKEYTNYIKKRKPYQGGNGYSNGGPGSSQSNKFSNHGNNGNRFDKYGGNNGGYSSNYSNRGEGRFSGHHSRYSNSPHRNNGNQSGGPGYYKKGIMTGNGNYDRNPKKFQDNPPPRYGGGNDDKYNGKQGYFNNNNNQGYQNNNGGSGGYGNRNNNFQYDYNNRNKFKDQGKNGGNNYGHNQYDNQHGQASQQSQVQSSQSHQQHSSQPQQQQNWQGQQQYGNKSSLHGGYQQEQGGRQDYYHHNQPSQGNQQQPISQSYHPESSVTNQSGSNITDNQPHLQQQQQPPQQQSGYSQQNYYGGNNSASTSGQYQQYSNSHYSQQGNSSHQYSHQQQPQQYGQQQAHPNQQAYPPQQYYGQTQDQQQQQNIHQNYGQQGANSITPASQTVASSQPSSQYYQHQYDNQQQQPYRYY